MRKEPMKDKPATREVLVGATREARRLGVTYQYLWKILTGTSKSPAFLLKVRRLRPQLLSSPICRVDWRAVCREHERDYMWDEASQRYVLKRSADKRRTKEVR